MKWKIWHRQQDHLLRWTQFPNPSRQATTGIGNWPHFDLGWTDFHQLDEVIQKFTLLNLEAMNPLLLAGNLMIIQMCHKNNMKSKHLTIEFSKLGGK